MVFLREGKEGGKLVAIEERIQKALDECHKLCSMCKTSYRKLWVVGQGLLSKANGENSWSDAPVISS